MLKIDATANTAPVGVKLGRVSKAITASLGRAVLKAANIAGGFIAREVVARLPGGTGNLAGSFLPAAFVDRDRGVAAGALSDLPHARVQDEGTGYLPGGVITAKPPLTNLAIPVTSQARVMWPRDWPEDALILKPQKDGTGAVLIEKATDTLQYILQPSVKIEGVGYLKAARARARREMPKSIGQDIAIEVRRAGGGRV